MDNALAYADAKGWKVTAFAATDGTLDDNDMYNWLERKGFPPVMAQAISFANPTLQTKSANSEVCKIVPTLYHASSSTFLNVCGTLFL